MAFTEIGNICLLLFCFTFTFLLFSRFLPGLLFRQSQLGSDNLAINAQDLRNPVISLEAQIRSKYLWESQKETLKNEIKSGLGPGVHYLTMASRTTEGLEALQKSAEIAGIHLEVSNFGNL